MKQSVGERARRESEIGGALASTTVPLTASQETRPGMLKKLLAGTEKNWVAQPTVKPELCGMQGPTDGT